FQLAYGLRSPNRCLHDADVRYRRRASQAEPKAKAPPYLAHPRLSQDYKRRRVSRLPLLRDSLDRTPASNEQWSAEHLPGWDRTGCIRRGNAETDRKSTRLNSSHVAISYAVFCLKKKKRAN